MSVESVKLVYELNALAEVVAAYDDKFLTTGLRHKDLSGMATGLNEKVFAAEAARDGSKVASQRQKDALAESEATLGRVLAGFRMHFGADSPEAKAIERAIRTARPSRPRKGGGGPAAGASPDTTDGGSGSQVVVPPGGHAIVTTHVTTAPIGTGG